MSSVLLEAWLFDESQPRGQAWRPEPIGIFRDPAQGGVHRRRKEPARASSAAPALYSVTFNATTALTANETGIGKHVRSIDAGVTLAANEIGVAKHVRSIDAAVTLTPTEAGIAKHLRSLDAAITLTPSETATTKHLRSLAATVALTANEIIVAKHLRALDAATTLAATEANTALHYRSLASGLTLTPAESNISHFYRTLAQGITLTPTESLQQLVKRTLAQGVILTSALSLRQLLLRSLTQSLTLAPSKVLQANKPLAQSVVLAVTLSESESNYRSLAASLSLSSSIQRKIVFSLSGNINNAISLTRVGSFFKSVATSFSFDVEVQKMIDKHVNYSPSFSLALSNKIYKSLVEEFLIDPLVSLGQHRLVSLDAGVDISAELLTTPTRLYAILLDGLVEFLADLGDLFTPGNRPPKPPDTFKRYRLQRRRQSGVEALEKQAERLLVMAELPKSYPEGAKKAWRAFQEFYGTLDGRRVFIKKALEQGNGLNVRDKVADVFATGTTVDQTKKLETRVKVKGRPDVKILNSSRGVKILKK
jgi:hypothetical protein